LGGGEEKKRKVQDCRGCAVFVKKKEKKLGCRSPRATKWPKKGNVLAISQNGGPVAWKQATFPY